MAKKFTYKGLEADAVKALTFEQFLALIPSNHRRTMKRQGTQVKTFLLKIEKLRKKGKMAFKTRVREMVIVPAMLGMTVSVYNGKEYVPVLISLDHLGRRLGEYSVPIKQVRHSGPGIGATRGSKAIELK
jgi:small subunit ribosomal protein S19